MNQPPISAWVERESDARLSNPANITITATRFQRKIQIRNLLEYAVGLLLVPIFGHRAWQAAQNANWLEFTSMLLIILGAGVMLCSLYWRASNLPAQPEVDCRTHLRAQLEHQRKALASVPWWYVMPIIPGVVLNFVARWVAISGDATQFRGFIASVVVSLVILIGVLWLNNRGARRLAREVAELDAQAELGRHGDTG